MEKLTNSRAMSLSIGAASQSTGVNIETIRYYERIGMLPPVPRTRSGRRIYAETEIRTLAFIRRARELGFGLEDIRALLKLRHPQHISCAEVRRIASRHLDAIRGKVADLRKLERLLTQTVSKCSGKKAPECPIIDILDPELRQN